jgi:hypothetical protein
MSGKQHYTKNTLGDMRWCGKCKRNTMHRVTGGRLGPCEECVEKLEQEHAKRQSEPAAAVQTSLFGGRQ